MTNVILPLQINAGDPEADGIYGRVEKESAVLRSARLRGANARTQMFEVEGVSRHDKPRERGGSEKAQNSLQELSGYIGIPPGKGWPPPETSLA